MSRRNSGARIACLPWLATVVSAAAAWAQTPVDLNTWSQQGEPADSTWIVSADGSSVLQTVNGGVGLFVSPNTYYNTTVEGRFGVESSSDDDFIGFVFGYKAPLDETTTTGQNTVDFLLFDWKQNNQSGAQAGFRLSHVQGTHKGTPSDVTHELWTHSSSTTLTVTPLASSFGTGWQDPISGTPVVYDFTLLYTADQIRIDIAGGQFGTTGQTVFDIAFDELDAEVQSVFEGGAFEEGRFGFYNYSQAQVRYQSFSLTEPDLATTPDDGGTLAFLSRVGEQDTQVVTVANAGGEGSLLTGSITAATAAPFAGPAESASFGIGSGDAKDFTYSFSPDARGGHADSVQVQTNVGTHTIALDGSAVGPVVTSSITPGTTIDLGQADLDESVLAILQIGNATPDANAGDDSLTDLTLDYVLSGDDASLFSLDLTPLDVVSKGGLLDVTITFLGSDVPGHYDATLTLLTDEGAALGDLLNGQSYTFTLSADVVPEPSSACALLGIAVLHCARRFSRARQM